MLWQLINSSRYYFWLALGRVRLWLKVHVLIQTPSVLVYQVGKVGSSTVCRSLKAALPYRPVFHIHYLNLVNLDKYNLRMKATFLAKGNIPEHLLESNYLRGRIDNGFDVSKWKIVTLVRDPVAIILSGFFFRQSAQNTLPAPADLAGEINDFLSHEYNYQWVLDWLDDELKSVFEVDVFQDVFPYKKGYRVYAEAQKPSVLVLRLEDLRRCSELAFREFLEVERLKLIYTNQAEHASYSGIYKEYIKTACITAELVDRIYDSKYARYFYTDQERAVFKSKWCN